MTLPVFKLPVLGLLQAQPRLCHRPGHKSRFLDRRGESDILRHGNSQRRGEKCGAHVPNHPNSHHGQAFHGASSCNRGSEIDRHVLCSQDTNPTAFLSSCSIFPTEPDTWGRHPAFLLHVAHAGSPSLSHTCQQKSTPTAWDAMSSSLPKYQLPSLKATTPWKPRVYDRYTWGFQNRGALRGRTQEPQQPNRSRAPTPPLKERRAKKQNATSNTIRTLEKSRSNTGKPYNTATFHREPCKWLKRWNWQIGTRRKTNILKSKRLISQINLYIVR